MMRGSQNRRCWRRGRELVFLSYGKVLISYRDSNGRINKFLLIDGYFIANIFSENIILKIKVQGFMIVFYSKMDYDENFKYFIR